MARAFRYQRGVDVLAHGPANEPAAVEVQDAGQIEPAFLGGNIGDVREPDLVGSSGLGSFGQAVGGDGLVVVTVGGLDPIAALLAAAQAGLLHEAGDAVAAVAASLFAQLIDDARAAVGLAALGMNRFDLLGQGLIGQRARARSRASIEPVVVAAGGDFQMLAQEQDRVIGFHRVDPFITLGGGSERMPSVFFKMSRCWRRCRISRKRHPAGPADRPPSRALPRRRPLPQGQPGQSAYARHIVGWAAVPTPWQ